MRAPVTGQNNQEGKRCFVEKLLIADPAACGIRPERLWDNFYCAPRYTILGAEWSAERQRLERDLAQQNGGEMSALLDAVRDRHAALKNARHEWEWGAKAEARVRTAVGCL